MKLSLLSSSVGFWSRGGLMEAGTNGSGSCVGHVPLVVNQEAPSLTPILRVQNPFSHLFSNTLNYLPQALSLYANLISSCHRSNIQRQITYQYTRVESPTPLLSRPYFDRKRLPRILSPIRPVLALVCVGNFQIAWLDQSGPIRQPSLRRHDLRTSYSLPRSNGTPRPNGTPKYILWFPQRGVHIFPQKKVQTEGYGDVYTLLYVLN